MRHSDNQTDMSNDTDSVDLVETDGLIAIHVKTLGEQIIHIKKIEKETDALLETLKNKSVFLKNIRAKLEDAINA